MMRDVCHVGANRLSLFSNQSLDLGFIQQLTLAKLLGGLAIPYSTKIKNLESMVSKTFCCMTRESFSFLPRHR